LWISADRSRYLVKFVASASTILELNKVETLEKGVPLTFEDKEYGFSFSVPAEWRFYRHITWGNFFVELLSPGLKAKAVLSRRDKIEDAGLGLKDIVSKDVESLTKLFKEYKVRSNLRKTQVGSRQAVEYTADLKEEANAIVKYEQPKDMVEYRIYVAQETAVYFFVFRAPKDKFDAEKSEFDAIVGSFQISKAVKPEPNSVAVE
jgi:hypothetical protein